MKSLSLLRQTLMTSLLFVGISAQAETLFHPNDKPLISIEMPTGWTAKRPDAETIKFEVPDGGAYSANVFAIGPIPPGSDVKSYLRESLTHIVESTAKRAGMTDLQLGDFNEFAGEDGMEFIGQRVDGQIKGEDWVIVEQAFVTPGGAAYVLLTTGKLEAHDRHDAEFELMLNSIAVAGE